jgi:hypothetical protein
MVICRCQPGLTTMQVPGGAITTVCAVKDIAGPFMG